MKRFTTAFLLVSATAFAACDRTDQDFAKAESVCQRSGFTPGTNEFANCVQQQFSSIQQNRAVIAAGVIASS